MVLDLDAHPGRSLTWESSRNAHPPLEYAYAVTPRQAAHSTAPTVFAVFHTHCLSGDTHHNHRDVQLALSRAQQRLMIFTDNRAALLAAIHRATPRWAGPDAPEPATRPHAVFVSTDGRAAAARPRPGTPLLPRRFAAPVETRLLHAAEHWQRLQAAQASSTALDNPVRLPASTASPLPRRPGAAPAGRGAIGAAAGLVLASARAAARGTATAVAGEQAERTLVRLVKEVGIHRALVLLPPALAHAVRGIREVARLAAGLGLDR